MHGLLTHFVDMQPLQDYVIGRFDEQTLLDIGDREADELDITTVNNLVPAGMYPRTR